ncbi:dihydrofolate reductase [Peribacillus loiseleuriae]|uniref:dihydrofolate reductase n=1 Tax=Peribacillus loiseleuriae TaxID=1679170 RepID=UPI000670C8F2|nr:dihydrofolate reductase [Peribacillus loiseleuriae]
MIHVVAAIDLSNGLGYKGKLLTKLKNDMKHFRELTTGGIVVMGSNTYEEIGSPLTKRTNIILYAIPNMIHTTMCTCIAQ